MNKEKREKTEAHHSATHLVHAALKRVLGDHVKQKGSLVDEHKLRFDFSHDESLSDEEISKIEDLVNQEILKNSAVSTKIMDLEDAKNSGAESLFGEKYEDQVRVLSIGEDDFSLELCGGTHISRTGDLGIFIITSQSSVASGIRRIEALSGPRAQEYLSNLKNQTIQLQKLLNAPAEEIEEKVSKLLKENKSLKKGGKTAKVASIKSSNIHDIDNFKLVILATGEDLTSSTSTSTTSSTGSLTVSTPFDVSSLTELLNDSPSSSKRDAPTSTVSPSSTSRDVTRPVNGDGTSVSTLSVDISKIGSSSFTSSPS